MITYAEFSLLESFDVGTKPLKMSKPNMRLYLTAYMGQNTPPELLEQKVQNMYNSYDNIEIFKLTSGVEDYIVFLLRNFNKTEVHFNNFKYVDFYNKTNKEKFPLNLLGEVFNIVYWFSLENQEIVTIEHDDKKRLDLYKSICNKILDKHKLKYRIEIAEETLELLPIPREGLTERFNIIEGKQ